jgi:hydrogenase expression/formation protein HypC
MCLAIPGRIISIDPGSDPILRTGRVSFGGVIKEVNLSMVPEAGVENYVLVHTGTAIQVVDEAEAMRTLKYLNEAGEIDELG